MTIAEHWAKFKDQVLDGVAEHEEAADHLKGAFMAGIGVGLAEARDALQERRQAAALETRELVMGLFVREQNRETLTAEQKRPLDPAAEQARQQGQERP